MKRRIAIVLLLSCACQVFGTSFKQNEVNDLYDLVEISEANDGYDDQSEVSMKEFNEQIYEEVNSGGSKQTCRWYTFKTTEPIREERVNKVCYKTQEEYLNVPLRRRQDIYSQMKYVCVSGPPQKCKRARRPTLLEDKVTFLDLLRYRNKYYQKKTKKGILRVRKGICGRASRFYKLKYGYICQKKPMKY